MWMLRRQAEEPLHLVRSLTRPSYKLAIRCAWKLLGACLLLWLPVSRSASPL